MIQPISVESDAIKIQVYPGYGGKVASVVDKADKFDLMFSYPRELPTKPEYDLDYGKGWYAGWDECFPGIAKAPYPLRPYEGAMVPDHGELWALPTESQKTCDVIVTRWNGLRFGYQLSRHILLLDNTLEARYELKNLAPFDFHFVWAMHSLMRLDLPVELGFAGNDAWRWSHKADGAQQNTPFTWPSCAPGQDLSRPNDLSAGLGWKLFSTHPIDKPISIFYPTRKRQLTVSYQSDSQIAAYWGIWINTGGWAGHRHFAIEPTTGRHDSLDTSIKDQSAAKVSPLSTVNWTVRWTVG